MRWMNSEGPLTSMMDNVLASRLGQAARSAQLGGDSIDHGLSLLRHLNEMGFEVRYKCEPDDFKGDLIDARTYQV